MWGNEKEERILPTPQLVEMLAGGELKQREWQRRSVRGYCWRTVAEGKKSSGGGLSKGCWGGTRRAVDVQGEVGYLTATKLLVVASGDNRDPMILPFSPFSLFFRFFIIFIFPIFPLFSFFGLFVVNYYDRDLIFFFVLVVFVSLFQWRKKKKREENRLPSFFLCLKKYKKGEGRRK